MQDSSYNTGGASHSGERGAGNVEGEKARFRSGPGPQVIAADSLESGSVENAQGEKLGKIEHIMLDLERGRIVYAVMSFGGMFGIGRKLFAIPWEALTLDAKRKRFLLDFRREEFESAPGFDEDRWPLVGDPIWVRQPYWDQPTEH